MKEACHHYQQLLSAHADGELDLKARAQVELHLSGCGECRGRVADLELGGRLLQERLMKHADEVDFSRFADQVLARITPARPPLLERLRIGWQEVLTYQRSAVIASFATAVVILGVGAPLVYRLARTAPPEVAVADRTISLKSLKLDDPNLQPVVMQGNDGRTIILLVNKSELGEGGANAPLEVEPPKGGDL